MIPQQQQPAEPQTQPLHRERPDFDLTGGRHHITGQVTVIPRADRVAFEAFTRQIMESFTLKSPAEVQLAHLFAATQWRINRAAALEEGLFSLAMAEDAHLRNLTIEHPEVRAALTQAAVYRDQSRAFERLSAYTHRLINQCEKLLKQLHTIQAEREAKEESMLQDMAALYTYHHDHHLSFDPKEFGCRLRVEEIEIFTRRIVTLKKARLHLAAQRA